MLDKLRQQSRSFIIWFLFGIIIVSFVVTFGPASMRLSCGGATRAGTVAGREMTNADLQFALYELRLRRQPHATLRLMIYDKLLRRELLVMEAERLGLKVTEDQVVKMITKRRRFILLGQELDLAMTGAWPTQRNKEGKVVPAPSYYHDRFKRWVQYQLGMKVKEFMHQQEKEMLAKAAEETIASGVIVSEREARAMYEYQNHSLQLEYARFRIADFQKGVLVNRAEVMRWLSQKENRDRVDAHYKKVKWKLTGLPLERRVRILLVKVDPKADAATKKAAKDKLEKLRLSLTKSPTDFAKMASLLSEDTATKASGGDLGWKEKGKLGLGKAAAEAIFKLTPLTVSPVLESERGYLLAYVEGERKGDVPLEKARVWLAEEMILQQKAAAAARKVAEEALRRLSMGQTMAQVFPPKGDDTKEDDTKEPGTDGKSSNPEDKKPKPKRWDDRLPTPQTVNVLRTETTIGQIGKIKGLVAKVWKLTDESPVLPEVVKKPGSGNDPGSLLVLRLKSKTVPSKEDFDSNKKTLMEDLLKMKQDDAVKRWVYQRCEALRADNKIKFNDRVSNVVFYQGQGDKRKKQVIKYVPCQHLERFGRMGSPFLLQ